MKKEKKTGLVGKPDENYPFYIYCNEKEYKGNGFLFKCCDGCRHNPSTEING